MKIQPSLLAATAIALGAGFMLGKNATPDPAVPASSTAQTLKPRSPRSAPASSTTTPAPGASVRTERPRAASSTESAKSAASTPGKVPSIIGGQDPMERTADWVNYVKNLAPDDFPGAVASFRSMGITEQRMSEYELLMCAWAKADPVAGLNFITQETSAPFAPQTILATWSATDPDAALGWAQANHKSDNPNPYLVGVIRGIADHDLTRAAEIAATMPQGREFYQAVEALMPSLFKDGPDAAKHWAESLTDQQFKAGAIQLMARRLAQTDPEGTASWIAKQNLEPRRERRLR
jgi:hypothetical protein